MIFLSALQRLQTFSVAIFLSSLRALQIIQYFKKYDICFISKLRRQSMNRENDKNVLKITLANA
jgi:hypothetical protein